MIMLQKYIDRAEKDKERFKKEKEDYDKKGGSTTSTPTKAVEPKKGTNFIHERTPQDCKADFLF